MTCVQVPACILFMLKLTEFCMSREIIAALPNLSFISQATIAAQRIFEMIDRIPVINSEDEKGKVLGYVKGEIEFREVDFSYPTRPDSPILKGFNLKVQAGKTVGLVGASGSGKSTVVSLLERFYDPANGKILLDGHKIKRLQLKWLRSLMGLVNQEPILFATSIKENILFGKEGASMEEVMKAAKAANAHDFIVKLSDAYETKVSQSCIFLMYIKLIFIATIDSVYFIYTPGRPIRCSVVRRSKTKDCYCKGFNKRSKDSFT